MRFKNIPNAIRFNKKHLAKMLDAEPEKHKNISDE